MNALSNQLMSELKNVLENIENDENLRVLLITGAGDKAFVAGADINELVIRDARIGLKVSKERQDLFSRIENLSVPVIAAINGYALGGGLELALACSIRICSEQAQFGAPEVKLGIIPGDGGTQRLPRLIGLGRAMEMILSGDFIDVQEAYRIGLVSRVVPQKELMPTAERIANRICENGPLAVKVTKELAYRGLEVPLEDGLRLHNALAMSVNASEDTKEGPRAFTEKRPPVYKGS